MSDEIMRGATEVVIEGNVYQRSLFKIVPIKYYTFCFRSEYDKKENYKSGYRHYESDDNSDSGGNNNYSTEPNNKVIVRGLAQHITEADVS